jgi:hypothetical protein
LIFQHKDIPKASPKSFKATYAYYVLLLISDKFH